MFRVSAATLLSKMCICIACARICRGQSPRLPFSGRRSLQRCRRARTVYEKSSTRTRGGRAAACTSRAWRRLFALQTSRQNHTLGNYRSRGRAPQQEQVCHGICGLRFFDTLSNSSCDRQVRRRPRGIARRKYVGGTEQVGRIARSRLGAAKRCRIGSSLPDRRGPAKQERAI